MTRPRASHEASPEPTAMAMEKMARKAVTTPSSPPSTDFTKGGRSDRITAPASQNQLRTTPPHRRRVSLQSSFRSVPVERTMFLSMGNAGAALPVGGIIRAAPQHKNANTMISALNEAGPPLPFDASPPAIVPSRIAIKVALSTSALPAGNSSRAR
jgi:hypothetical protein